MKHRTVEPSLSARCWFVVVWARFQPKVEVEQMDMGNASHHARFRGMQGGCVLQSSTKFDLEQSVRKSTWVTPPPGLPGTAVLPRNTKAAAPILVVVVERIDPRHGS